MTKREMEEEIGTLKAQRSALVSTKQDLQAELARINAECSTRLPQSRFGKIQKDRSGIVAMMSDIEKKIREINIQVTQLSIDKGAQDPKETKSISTIESLVRIRDEYQEFSADKTRVGSMRQMAAEFVMKLNPIIRKFVND